MKKQSITRSLHRITKESSPVETLFGFNFEGWNSYCVFMHHIPFIVDFLYSVVVVSLRPDHVPNSLIDRIRGETSHENY